jgi:hypothetical protein
MTKTLTVKLLGVEWTVKFTRLRGQNDGYCYDPENRRILIHNKLTPKRELEVVIHEALHAADWHKDESWVKVVAKELSQMLWRLGYRRDHEQSEI